MDAEEHGLRAPCRCHPEPRGLHILERSLHSGADVLGTLLSQSLTLPAKPGPGGALGALEGISYLFVPGLVAYSLYTKVPPSPPPPALSRSAGGCKALGGTAKPLTDSRHVFQVKTGKGLPPGPGGALGAAEGMAFLAVLAGIVVLGLQAPRPARVPRRAAARRRHAGR
jgi:hypothetical protein